MTNKDGLERKSETDRGETVDARYSQGFVYKPSGPVTQHFTTIIYEGTKVVIPSSQAVAEHRVALRKKLEQDAQARWGGMSVYIQEEGATLPIEASPYQEGRLGPRENLLETLHEADRLLVLGEPGSGKTVTLERLAWELCNGDDPTVPVLIRLFQYDGAELGEWVRAFLQGTSHLRLDSDQTLTAFLKEGVARCVFLFDGLNEAAPPYRDKLVGELVRWAASYPRHPVILTSRSQDELWRRLRESIGQAVVVQPIGDKEARAYLVKHLGDKGKSLYGQLDTRLRGLAQTPLVLWLIKEAGAAGESLPGNRGELYESFVSKMLGRDTAMIPKRDAEKRNRTKRRAMATLAYHLNLEQRLLCSWDEALEVVAQRLDEDEAKATIEACAKHGLLAGDDPVWFAPHQTVQEYFAALALQDMMDQERNLGLWARLGRRVRQLATRQKEGLAGLAEDDWWMETFVQLAGLVEDADWLAREVLRTNPWLAWWCVQEGQEVSEKTEDEIASQSERLLASARVADRRRAVATLTRIQSDRALLPLFRAAADPDREVGELAAQALAGVSEAARALVREALQGQDRHLWRAALRCLKTQPDDLLCAAIPDRVWEGTLGQPMVWVPPGPFTMGAEKTVAEQLQELSRYGVSLVGPWGGLSWEQEAQVNELPQHQMTLPGYWIGRYPVTVAQFRAFVEESRYGLTVTDKRGLGRPEDHPITLVTWHDAIAYCRWLTEKSGVQVTLPSEAEWEKAARGTNGRIYPWGEKWDRARCNSKRSGIDETTPVDKYSPGGDSPYGCADMAGNVWEWTRSLWGRDSYTPEFEYPYDPKDGRENLDASDMVCRVVRGGSFSSTQDSARCSNRFWLHPEGQYATCGFRIIVPLISP